MTRDEGGGASKSTDPAVGTSAATDVSLREYLGAEIQSSRRECREGIRHVEEMIEAARKNADDNTEKALASIDKRFESVNEFRDALSDLSSTMASKDDVKNLTEKMIAADEALEHRFEALYQRNRDDIDKIYTRMNLREGQDMGSRLTTGTLVTIVSVSVAVIGLIVVIVNVILS